MTCARFSRGEFRPLQGDIELPWATAPTSFFPPTAHVHAGSAASGELFNILIFDDAHKLGPKNLNVACPSTATKKNNEPTPPAFTHHLPHSSSNTEQQTVW
jgi:hypothetical protein